MSHHMPKLPKLYLILFSSTKLMPIKRNLSNQRHSNTWPGVIVISAVIYSVSGYKNYYS